MITLCFPALRHCGLGTSVVNMPAKRWRKFFHFILQLYISVVGQTTIDFNPHSFLYNAPAYSGPGSFTQTHIIREDPAPPYVVQVVKPLVAGYR